jgi:polyhydroxyalkanoate synthase
MAKKKEDVIAEYMANFAKFSELYSKATAESLANDDIDLPMPYKSMMNILGEMTSKFMENPEKLYQKQVELFTDYVNVWNNSWQRYIGEGEQPLYPSDPKDRRFKDSAWNEDLTFDFIKQSYILTTQWLKKMVGDIEGVDQKTLDKFEFYTRQLVDAMSPSNFAMTNPEVIRESINTKGASLAKGFQNFMEDFESGKTILNLPKSDHKAFELGRNIAATPGKVIFRNDLIELIQYEPIHAQSYKTPLLLMPAWINKYYIMDLSEDNSFVRWVLDKGYTVFIISWVNPDKNHASKKFEDYMLEGPLAALDAIYLATGEKQVNVMGYCLGGTLLSCAMAYLKSKNDSRIKSATLLTTMVDFSYVGDMSVFIDEIQLNKLDEQMQAVGFLDSSELSAVFNAMRANDLIWSVVVNHYLLGRDLLPFDILYWNADATRMPATAHSFYLRHMYLKNLLRKKGGLTLAGVPIDVSKVDTPAYILSTIEDHIAPWKTTFETTKLFCGETKFVLAGSGHVVGVINPPEKNKYGYWLNDKLAKTAEEWLNGAVQNDGSWWDNWHEWNKGFSGEKIPSPKPGSGKLKPLCNAPGEYVKINGKLIKQSIV